jgi:hypothetical protein
VITGEWCLLSNDSILIGRRVTRNRGGPKFTKRLIKRRISLPDAVLRKRIPNPQKACHRIWECCRVLLLWGL